MKANQNPISKWNPGVIAASCGRSMAIVLLGAVAFMVAGQISAQAQDRQVWAQFVRMTVPTGVSGSMTNNINVVTTNDVTPVTLSVGALPAGVTSAFFSGTTSFTAPGSNATLTVNYNGTVPQSGVNEIEILATGDYTYRLPIPINSAKVWAGSTNNNLWSASGNWSSAGAPSASDVVVFGSTGASPAINTDTNSPAFYTNVVTNVVISANQTVGQLRFAHGDRVGGTPDGDANYRVEIKSGATLAVTGSGGFTLLQDTLNSAGNIGVGFFGGGSLLVSNASANITLLKPANTESILDMGGLNTFVANVDRIGLGEYQLYPYYTTNGYSVRGGAADNSRPSRWIPRVALAKTNILRATHVDPNNYTNATVREYALSLVNNESQGGSSAEPQRFWFLLGQTNNFLMDSMVVAASVGKGESAARGLRFNTDTNVIPTNMVPVAYFRGADGTSRMSVFTVADNSGPGSSGNSSKGIADFSGGRVDALVDRLYVGRDRQECSDNDVAQGELTMAAGVFDVNTAYISSQELGNNTLPVEDQEGDDSGEVYGTLNVSTSGVFRVNGTLHLGYTTADASDIRIAEDGNGALSINNGGKLMASNIVVGGVTKVSVNNRISMSAGGELIVSNEIAASDKYLNTLTMSDSTLTVHLNGSKSTPYVYANTVTTGGGGNTIKLASIVNVFSFPTQLPIIAYNTASPNFGVTMPSGFYGYVVDNTVNKTIDVVILNTPPANLVWRGTPGTTWDTSAANWQGGSVFANGDTARFDDTASVPTVSVAGTVYLGGSGVVITNNALAFTIGGGTIGGTVPMNKWGTNSVAINATSELPLTINEGSVTGTGSVGSTLVKSNTTLNFAGTATRLSTSGSSTLSSSATVANGATVTGGTLVSSGKIRSSVNISGSGAMTLASGGAVEIPVPATYGIDGTNASLVLNGFWTNGILNGPDGIYRFDVTGTLKGTGSILTGKPEITHGSGTAPAYWSRLVLGSGGVLSPGAAPGNIIVFTNQSQLDFQTGSTIILDVNMDSAPGSAVIKNAATGSTLAKSSDQIYTSRWSTRTGTLKMNRLGATPWTNGTVLKVLAKPLEQAGGGFRNRVFDGVINQTPSMDPASPGLGLIWNLENFATNGVITIEGTASTPPTLVATPMLGTNMTFSWPTNYQGWQLQTQVNPLTVGLSSNWTVLKTVSSPTDTSLTITNWISKELELKVYRMAHPSYQ